jgi:hypothetical protein
MATHSTIAIYIQNKAEALTGIKFAPDYPVEASTIFPFTITYVRHVEANPMSAGWYKELVRFVTEIHVARDLLPLSVALAAGFGQTFYKAILGDPTLGGNVDNITHLSGDFGSLEWGRGETHIGWRFEIEVKQEETL